MTTTAPTRSLNVTLYRHTYQQLAEIADLLPSKSEALRLIAHAWDASTDARRQAARKAVSDNRDTDAGRVVVVVQPATYQRIADLATQELATLVVMVELLVAHWRALPEKARQQARKSLTRA